MAVTQVYGTDRPIAAQQQAAGPTAAGKDPHEWPQQARRMLRTTNLTLRLIHQGMETGWHAFRRERCVGVCTRFAQWSRWGAVARPFCCAKARYAWT